MRGAPFLYAFFVFSLLLKRVSAFPISATAGVLKKNLIFPKVQKCFEKFIFVRGFIQISFREIEQPEQLLGTIVVLLSVIVNKFC